MILRANVARPYNRSFAGVNHDHVDESLHVGPRGNWGKAARQMLERQGAARGGSALSGVRQGGSSPDAAKIEAASIGFATSLHNRLKRPDVLYRRFAKVLRTNKLLNREIWLDNVPKMRLWEGDKVLSMLRAESLSIVTRPHEASIMVPKGDILNDELGLYQDRINNLGDSYNWHLDEMFIGMLIAGLQGTALGTTYDGQNLIDTDHTYLGNGTGATYSNKVTGALSATTYNQAWDLFLKMKDENGLPIGPGGRRATLLVGPSNRQVARTILQQEQVIGGTATNLDKGTADLEVSPWITAGATYNVFGQTITLTGLEWFLILEGSTAIMIQIKRDVEFLAVDKGDDEFTFRTGKLLYGIESEDGAAYGMPQEIVGGPGA
jgi:phage major head subunit gpT-like protein